jgi:hypothetical protein
MKKCPQCGVLMADKQEFCLNGHKQGDTGMPAMTERLKDLFVGEFEHIKRTGSTNSTPKKK